MLVLWVVGMKLKSLTMDELQVQYDHALDRARALEPAPHIVRNCISDLERRDAAWREVHNLQYQLECRCHGKEIY